MSDGFENNLISVAPSESLSIPRTVVFGGVEVTENLNEDLISERQRGVFNRGFDNLKKMVKGSSSESERGLLITPDLTSCVVGLQPLISLYPREAEQVSRNLNRQRIEGYGLFAFNSVDLLVNFEAAEMIIRQHASVLGLSLSEEQLTSTQVVDIVSGLFGDNDLKRANLAHGLLSGFPLEDCQFFVDNGQVNRVPSIQKRGFVRKTQGMIARQFIPRHRLYSNTPLEEFLPDMRNVPSADSSRGIIEGFGLRWAAQIPPKETTIKHCQMLLQVDRELGLLNFILEQKIAEKDLSSSSPKSLLRKRSSA